LESSLKLSSTIPNIHTTATSNAKYSQILSNNNTAIKDKNYNNNYYNTKKHYNKENYNSYNGSNKKFQTNKVFNNHKSYLSRDKSSRSESTETETQIKTNPSSSSSSVSETTNLSNKESEDCHQDDTKITTVLFNEGEFSLIKFYDCETEVLVIYLFYETASEPNLLRARFETLLKKSWNL
jgi:hypothetical protein